MNRQPTNFVTDFPGQMVLPFHVCDLCHLNQNVELKLPTGTNGRGQILYQNTVMAVCTNCSRIVDSSMNTYDYGNGIVYAFPKEGTCNDFKLSHTRLKHAN